MKLSTVLSLVALSAAARADTLQVPAEYPTIQAALSAAAPGDTVLVADGTYTGQGNKELFFPQTPVTLRSEGGSDRCVIDLQGERRAFIFASNESPETLVEGFTIQNGNAASGGAVLLSLGGRPTIRNCAFIGNSAHFGGAVAAASNGEARFEDCSFLGNSAVYGGAIYGGWASTFVRCVIRANTAVLNGGGASGSHLVDCVVVGNLALGSGGGVHGGEVDHCTLAGNSALVKGGGFAVRGASAGFIRNCVLWGNTAPDGAQLALYHDNLPGPVVTVEYSDLQGGEGAVHVDPGALLDWAAGNIDVDPLFADLSNLDVRLRGGSPAIDAADPFQSQDPERLYDVQGFGHLRRDDGNFDGLERPDMGAVEFGGFLGNGTVAVGAALQLEVWGKPNGVYALALGAQGTHLDLGVLGVLFLDPFASLVLAVRVLPASGTEPALQLAAPASAVGLTMRFQAVHLGAVSHLTNLEAVTVVP